MEVGLAGKREGGHFTQEGNYGLNCVPHERADVLFLRHTTQDLVWQ